MRATFLLSTIVALGFVGAAVAQPTATLTLESTANGQTVNAGDPIDWTIKIAVSQGDNFGLALVSVDLVQDSNNPEPMDISPASGVPTPMANFARPAGIANPDEGGPGYCGVQRGTSPGMNLIQVGGGQNSFGEALPPGTGLGENAVLVGGIGQGASPEVVAMGSFNAPSAQGTYTFNLANAIVNVLDELNAPPNFSQVSRVQSPDITGGTISFTVQTGPTWCLGDSNCSGGSAEFTDIQYFVAALTSEASWVSYHQQQLGQPPACPYGVNDINGGGVGFDDIQPFVALLGAACSPYTP